MAAGTTDDAEATGAVGGRGVADGALAGSGTAAADAAVDSSVAEGAGFSAAQPIAKNSTNGAKLR